MTSWDICGNSGIAAGFDDAAETELELVIVTNMEEG